MPIHPVNKPLGLTSHDVVAQARRRLGTRRVGHAGTLDPLATGVLVVLADEATKLSPFLTASNKRYLAWVALGAGTATLDAEGPLTTEAEPSALAAIDERSLRQAGKTFLGMTAQRPPAFSAIKQQGERSYAAAREGRLEEPPERAVAYHHVELLAFAPSRGELPGRFSRTQLGWRPDPEGTPFELPAELTQLPTALFELEVGAGTYVRSFARDLGAALGVPAHLTGLVRTAAGAVDLGMCTPLEELTPSAGVDPLALLPQPKLTLDAPTALAVRQGKKVRLPITGVTVLLDEAARLVAVVEPRDRPESEPQASEGPAADGTQTARGVRVLRAWQQ